MPYLPKNFKGWVFMKSSGRESTNKPQPEYGEYFYVQCEDIVSYFKIELVGGYRPAFNVFYSIDKAEWQEYQFGDNINFTRAGQKIYFKANTRAWGASQTAYARFVFNESVKLGGNIVSLILGDGFVGENLTSDNTDDYTFIRLFDCRYSPKGKKITDASKLAMPIVNVKTFGLSYFLQGNELTQTPLLDRIESNGSSGTYNFVYECPNLTDAWCNFPARQLLNGNPQEGTIHTAKGTDWTDTRNPESWQVVYDL